MQRLKNGKRRQVPHRKRAKFGGSALIGTVHQLVSLNHGPEENGSTPVGLDDQPGTSLECMG